MRLFNENVRRYADICKRFAADTIEWSRLPTHNFFTTSGDGWKETCDNAHGGLDVSWAFHLDEKRIEESAAEELFELLMEMVRLARDDEWDTEGYEYIYETFSNI